MIKDSNDREEAIITALANKLKRRELVNSEEIAIAIVQCCRQIIAKSRWQHTRELLTKMQALGSRLIASNVNEVIIGNMIRRVLHIIREEYKFSQEEQECNENAGDGALSPRHGTSVPLSKSKLLSVETLEDYASQRGPSLKSAVQDEIKKLMAEIQDSSKNIAASASKYVHSGEIILTLGMSRTVLAFLIEAARKRKIQVIVAEAAPYMFGHQMAVSLAKAGIDVTLITDSAVYALMARVNQVIIGTRSIMADGSLMATNGAHGVALAAKSYAVPVIVLAGLYKISPEFKCAYNHDTFNNLVTPDDVMEYASQAAVVSHVYNPLYDFVPGDLVSLIVTGQDAPAPSYLYHVIGEIYHQDDYEPVC